MKTDEKGRPLTYWGGLDKSKKQTAVEWLADEIIMLEERLRQEEINLNDFMDLKDDLVTKAKEMEKQESLKKIIYDLDELASEYSEGKSTSEVFKRAHESDFKAGFQKAIELLTFKTTEQ